MYCEKLLRFACIGVFYIWIGNVRAEDISGTISTTQTITNDSKLVGDTTCAVTGATCIAFGASGITLELNGFSLTGLGDSDNGCAGQGTVGEFGIDVNGRDGVVIRGPGLVQRFRQAGIRVNNSNGVTVAGVTVSTNCWSGI